jgi:hypothetical protein
LASPPVDAGCIDAERRSRWGEQGRLIASAATERKCRSRLQSWIS